jgi:two-component system CitB family sensor kinase
LTYDDLTRVITIAVSDSGPGVVPELTEAVFQDGYTTKAPRGRVQRGLGLALVHRLVKRLGGSIFVTPGPGGTFTATLPVAVPTAVPVPAGATTTGVDG